MGDESDDDLPLNWEVKQTDDGQLFYVNHQIQATQWEHPITKQITFVSKELPFGWKQTVDEHGKTIYIDTTNKFQTEIDPRLAFLRDSDTNDVVTSCSHQSTALQLLYGTNLTERTAIVTGANSGIGFEIALSLAKHGCQVILACRNLAKGEAACQKIRQEKADANVSCRELNLCSLRSVKVFIELFRKDSLPLHLLILNAGVLNVDFRLTEDGYEEMFQVNYLAQFFLANGLLPSMLMTRTHVPARIVAVSCESHRVECPGISSANGILIDRLTPNAPNNFDNLVAYGQSKLCLIMFIAQFRRMYRQVYSVSCHPGNLVRTNLMNKSIFYQILSFVSQPFCKTLQQAAATPIFCSVMKCVLKESAVYYNNCFDGSPSSIVNDVKLLEDLWVHTQDLIESALKRKPIIA